MLLINYHYLREQDGCDLLHAPVASHVRVAEPSISYPDEHVYVAVSSTYRELTLTVM